MKNNFYSGPGTGLNTNSRVSLFNSRQVMLTIFVLTMVRLELNGVKDCLRAHNQKVAGLDLNSDLTPKPVPYPLRHPASQTWVWVFAHLSTGYKSLGKLLESQSHWLKRRHIMSTCHILFGPSFMKLMLVPFRGVLCPNITSLCFSSIAPPRSGTTLSTMNFVLPLKSIQPCSPRHP